MAIVLQKELRARVLKSVQAWWANELDESIGVLQAERILDFFLAEIGPPIHNRAIEDAQTWLLGKAQDLDADLFERHEPYRRDED